MSDIESSGWFGVRCLFDWGPRQVDDGTAAHTYEERITIWQAANSDDAIERAEAEAAEYAEMIDGTFLGLTQTYEMYDDLREGAEVFSLVRLADQSPTEYIDQFFDTGTERQHHWQGNQQCTDAGPSAH